MSELADSPVVGRRYCPGCEPDADPWTEILDVSYCDAHVPPRDGWADSVVAGGNYLSGSGEVEGESNRRWCDWVHRGRAA